MFDNPLLPLSQLPKCEEQYRNRWGRLTFSGVSVKSILTKTHVYNYFIIVYELR